MEIRDYAEYPCKCGEPMTHAVGDTAVLVAHGPDRRSVVPGDAGRYDALDWIAGLHAAARERADTAFVESPGGATPARKRRKKDGEANG